MRPFQLWTILAAFIGFVVGGAFGVIKGTAAVPAIDAEREYTQRALVDCETQVHIAQAAITLANATFELEGAAAPSTVVRKVRQ